MVMVKKMNIWLSLFLLIGTLNAYSQKKTYWGIMGGINHTTITVEKDRGWKNGMNLGSFVEWNVFPRTAVNLGLYYSEFGTKNHQFDADEKKYKQTVKISYLQLPVTVKYYVFKGFNLFAGPQIAYKLKSVLEPDLYLNIIFYGKDFECNGIIGAGYQFDFGLMFSANYLYGFTRIEDLRMETNEDYARKFSLHHSAFQFNTGWRF
jgi:hypothetical protein